MTLRLSSVQFVVAAHESRICAPAFFSEVSPNIGVDSCNVRLVDIALHRSLMEDRQTLLLSTPLSSRLPMVSGPWICAHM